jgi:hypothetical protein
VVLLLGDFVIFVVVDEVISFQQQLLVCCVCGIPGINSVESKLGTGS